MKKFLKHFRSGEKGFTLIELLIVVAILGVLAAVVIPNVGKFIGRGTLEAANGEATGVQTAVFAAMVDENVLQLQSLDDFPVGEDPSTSYATVGPGRDTAVTGATVNLTVEDYFTGNLEATYYLGTNGSIGDAKPEATGKWKDLAWNTGLGVWTEQ